MKKLYQILLLSLLIPGCVIQFIPETNEDQNLLVVEGLITDKPGPNTVKLSLSQPLGEKNEAKPISGCNVTISDDLGNSYELNETTAGTYITNEQSFTGTAGRSYTLHIKTNSVNNNFRYESFPMKLKPVPPIDSLFYEKKTIVPNEIPYKAQEGCQIYLNTHEPSNQCKYYRWEYSETWAFKIPYHVPNTDCWVTNNSDVINIKNTSGLAEDIVYRYPLTYISNLTDRLKIKYSILVNQYSLNEDEYLYWEKVHNITEQVGGLYDMIPADIPSNVYCLDDPGRKVLGYFSVSANTSKRIFIEDTFYGLVNQYKDCVDDTIRGGETIPGLDISAWIIIVSSYPPYVCITYNKSCADCTVRGTNKKPDFWDDNK